MDLSSHSLVHAFVFIQVKLQIKGQNHNVDVESSKILNEYYRRFYDEHKNIQMEITSEKTNTYFQTAYHEGAYSKPS